MDLQKLIKRMKKICFLPPLPTLLIAVPSFVLVIWVLVNESVHPLIANLAYVLSAYALVITITGVAGIVKWVRAGKADGGTGTMSFVRDHFDDPQLGIGRNNDPCGKQEQWFYLSGDADLPDGAVYLLCGDLGSD